MIHEILVFTLLGIACVTSKPTFVHSAKISENAKVAQNNMEIGMTWQNSWNGGWNNNWNGGWSWSSSSSPNTWGNLNSFEVYWSVMQYPTWNSDGVIHWCTSQTGCQVVNINCKDMTNLQPGFSCGPKPLMPQKEETEKKEESIEEESTDENKEETTETSTNIIEAYEKETSESSKKHDTKEVKYTQYPYVWFQYPIIQYPAYSMYPTFYQIKMLTDVATVATTTTQNIQSTRGNSFLYYFPYYNFQKPSVPPVNVPTHIQDNYLNVHKESDQTKPVLM